MVARNVARVASSVVVAALVGLTTHGATWPRIFLCNHCHTLFVDWDMTLEQVRFEVIRILHAHAAKLERAANASRRVRALEQKRGK